ncbi:LCP family protein [Pseudonocardia sp. H11422]|uniref:LCP family glycopolymer transferase n=1 Tax=Pseudonocardia sp. H11422 TaxID=2835866 RepID=UPI0027E2A515|nr:LCP family protein [Pseudonocardia sp. H11422]
MAPGRTRRSAAGRRPRAAARRERRRPTPPDTIVLLRIPADPADPVVAVSNPPRLLCRHHGWPRPPQDQFGLPPGPGGDGAVAHLGQLTGVRVDHYAEINLAGLVELTDAIDDIPVCLDGPVDDGPYSGVDLSRPGRRPSRV